MSQVCKISVVVPHRAEYGELIDNHQLEFAQSLATEGSVVVVEDITKLKLAANEALARQADLARRPFS